MSRPGAQHQPTRCVGASIATAHWVGVVKAEALLHRIKTDAVADGGRRVDWAVSEALNGCDPAERHAFLSVLCDVLTAGALVVDISALCARHERHSARDAECVLGFVRRQAARKAASAAHARAAKAAKRAAGSGGQPQDAAGACRG